MGDEGIKQKKKEPMDKDNSVVIAEGCERRYGGIYGDGRRLDLG